MDQNTTKDKILKVDTISVSGLPKLNKESEADEIVIYDECGDTLWDRVLRQEENKLKFSPEEMPE